MYFNLRNNLPNSGTFPPGHLYKYININIYIYIYIRSRDSVVCIVSMLRREDQKFESRKGQVIYLLAKNRPDGLWYPPNLVLGGYRSIFLVLEICWGVKLTTGMYLQPRLKASGAIFHSSYMPSCRVQGRLLLLSLSSLSSSSFTSYAVLFVSEDMER